MKTITVEVDEYLASWLLNHFRDGVGYSKGAYDAVAKAIYQQCDRGLFAELGFTRRDEENARK